MNIFIYYEHTRTLNSQLVFFNWVNLREFTVITITTLEWYACAVITENAIIGIDSYKLCTLENETLLGANES